ncbi:MAG: CoA-disulfide reductase [Epulopiscium sp.]|nr:CoA-disulfide reductase [Candidatus Epulonipiscium sp.]
MRIVIIGGIAAGMSAAAKAARTNKDAEIILYEKSDIISLGACGLPYYIGGFFDNPNYMIARTVDQAREMGIDVNIKHEVIAIDPNSKTLQVKNLQTNEFFEDHYDNLMIATGASPIIPPIDNIDIGNVFVLKDMNDGKQIKEIASQESNKNIVIVGAGYIGIELVEAMKEIGKNVRVIQLDDSIIPGSFDKEITEIMEEELKKHKVDLNLSEMVKSLEGKEKVEKVITNKGEYDADLVIIATGVRPNTSFIKDSGIEMLENGAIIIDKYGKTNLEYIYSAGDCATVYHKIKKENVYIPLATTANKIGRMVGENLTGLEETFSGTLGSAAIKVMELEAARTGISESEAKEMGIDYGSVFVTDKNQTNYYPGAEDIYVKLIYDKASRVILGGQIIGKVGAVLRVDVLAAAVDKEMTVEELGNLDLSYSPPFSKTWDILNVAGNVAK